MTMLASSPLEVRPSDRERTAGAAAPQRTDDGRLRALDGVRGIAILLVMLCHFFQHGGMRPAIGVDRVVHALATTGWIGVDLFFVLSGFLITRILLHSKGSARYFRNFYVRRALRILPLFYGACAIAFLVVPVIVDPTPGFRQLLSQQIWYWGHLANVLIARDGWPAIAGSVGHFWSLAVEEQFYLVWPAVVLVFQRNVLFRVAVALIVTSAVIRIAFALSGNAVAAFVLTPARMDTLAVGALIAMLATGPADSLATARRWAPAALALALGGMAAILIDQGGLSAESFVVQAVGYPLLAALFGAVLVIVLSSPGTAIERLLESKPLVALGRYSYALYIFHLPVAAMLAKQMSARSFPEIAGSQLPGQVAFALVAMSISYALALFSWHAYEVHFLNLKALFPYSRQRVGVGEASLAASVVIKGAP